jgi:5-methylcytosine-specific restriction endonuclease McrA
MKRIYSNAYKKRISNCLNCNQLNQYGYSRTGKFCNNNCQGEYIYKTVTLPNIEKGKSVQRSMMEKYLSYRDGYSCSECGLKKWKSKDITLDIDHIDGNKRNNFPTNLRFLCPNCHRQTKTWGRKKRDFSIQ